MFKLIIKKADQSIYWNEHFNTLDEAHKWIDEEKTRPYWDKLFTYEIEYLRKVETPEDIELKEKIRLRSIRINDLKKKTEFTKEETAEIIKMTLDTLG